MVTEIVWLGLVCLLAPAISEYSGLRKKSERGFNWVGIAGLMFILAGAFDSTTMTLWNKTGLGDLSTGGNLLFQLIGWIFIIVGVLSATFETLKKK